MPPKRRTSAGNGRVAQSKQPAKRPALSLLDTDDTDDKKPPAPKRPVKRARKTTQAQARTRTRSNSHEDEDGNADDDDDRDALEMRVANINRKRSKPSKAPPATVEEYLMEQNQQAKDFLKGFKQELLESQANAQESLEKFKRELHDVQNNDEEDFRKIYATLKATVTTDKTKNPTTAGTKATNPLFTTGQQLTKLCRNILQRHQIAERDSQLHNPTVPREIWGEDYTKMRQLLDYGRKYGEKLVEGIISPDANKGDSDTPSKDGEKEAEDLGEPETLAVGLFDKSKKKSEETETWGRVAHAQVKALAAVVRTVP
ncbi:hypothetical protein B0T20DRAFT_441036 [Sordaria brevicollis]|uniref:Uncharacterized protein n=1 Tax=Sordaria brevicollis TaxID=83679 RepID=A0AAE0UBD0_SORBR|nr:hypothetical protein B0T20DRAFT_441036 [Sordaria brevicollis]